MRDKHIPVTAQIVVNEDEFFCPVGLSLSLLSLLSLSPRSKRRRFPTQGAPT
jgi:hypothetical protein